MWFQVVPVNDLEQPQLRQLCGFQIQGLVEHRQTHKDVVGLNLTLVGDKVVWPSSCIIHDAPL